MLCWSRSISRIREFKENPGLCPSWVDLGTAGFLGYRPESGQPAHGPMRPLAQVRWFARFEPAGCIMASRHDGLDGSMRNAGERRVDHPAAGENPEIRHVIQQEGRCPQTTPEL